MERFEYVLKTKYDHFTHHCGDTETLKEIIFGLSDDQDLATRIGVIAGQMRIGDGFATDGILLTCEEEK